MRESCVPVGFTHLAFVSYTKRVTYVEWVIIYRIDVEGTSQRCLTGSSLRVRPQYV